MGRNDEKRKKERMRIEVEQMMQDKQACAGK